MRGQAPTDDMPGQAPAPRLLTDLLPARQTRGDLLQDPGRAGRAGVSQFLQREADDPIRPEQVAGVVNAGNARRNVNICTTCACVMGGQDDGGHAQGRGRLFSEPRYPKQAVRVRFAYASAGRASTVEIDRGGETGLPRGYALPGCAAVAAAQGQTGKALLCVDIPQQVMRGADDEVGVVRRQSRGAPYQDAVLRILDHIGNLVQFTVFFRRYLPDVQSLPVGQPGAQQRQIPGNIIGLAGNDHRFMVIAAGQFGAARSAQVSQFPLAPGKQRIRRIDGTFDKPGKIAGHITTDKDDGIRPVFDFRQGGGDPATGLQRLQVMHGIRFLRVRQRGIRLFGQLQGRTHAVGVCTKAGNQWFTGLLQELCRRVDGLLRSGRNAFYGRF